MDRWGAEVLHPGPIHTVLPPVEQGRGRIHQRQVFGSEAPLTDQTGGDVRAVDAPADDQNATQHDLRGPGGPQVGCARTITSTLATVMLLRRFCILFPPALPHRNRERRRGT